MKYEFLEHTADIKFKAFGKTLNETFNNAAQALSHHISRGEKINLKQKKTIKIEASDLKSLLYKFLDEILYLIDADNFITAKASVKINTKSNSLTATLHGDNTANYSDLDHVKAATYAEMHIKKTPSGFEVQAVVDV